MSSAMRMTDATAALVALEDDAPDAMFATLGGTGLPLWPLLRWPLASALAQSRFDSNLVPRQESVLSKAKRFARTAAPSSRWSRSLRGPVPVLFAGPGIRTVPTASGYFDPLLGPFAEMLGDDAAVLQFEPVAGDRRPTFEPTVTLDDAIVLSELRARIAPPSRAVVVESREVAQEILSSVDFELGASRRDRALRTFDVRVRRAASLAESYARLLDRVRPRLLILQAAAYGDRASLVIAAHERGIHVAEPQHGWIGPSHGAYNFGAAASDPRLGEWLPDTLLTFGTFWSESIRAPFATAEVGKPPLDDARADAAPIGERPAEVLFVSTITDATETVRFIKRLHEVVPVGWTVVFRPHPQERAAVAQRYPGLFEIPGVRIDDEPDPFRAFARCRVVVGATSTALYESIALGTPTVIRSSDLTPYYMDPEIFGNTIAPGEDPGPAIRRAIERPELQVPPALVERVWARDGRALFRRWADATLRPSATA